MSSMENPKSLEKTNFDPFGNKMKPLERWEGRDGISGASDISPSLKKSIPMARRSVHQAVREHNKNDALSAHQPTGSGRTCWAGCFFHGCKVQLLSTQLLPHLGIKAAKSKIGQRVRGLRRARRWEKTKARRREATAAVGGASNWIYAW